MYVPSCFCIWGVGSNPANAGFAKEFILVLPGLLQHWQVPWLIVTYVFMTQSDATIQSFHKLSRLANIFAKLSFASRHLDGIFTVFSYFHTCSFGSFWATESQKFQAALGRTWISRKFDKTCADSLDHFDCLNVRCTAQCLQLASVKLECSGMLFGLWIGLEYDAQRPTPWRRCTVHMKNDMYVAEKVMGTHGIVSRSRDCLGWHCRGFFLCVPWFFAVHVCVCPSSVVATFEVPGGSLALYAHGCQYVDSGNDETFGCHAIRSPSFHLPCEGQQTYSILQYLTVVQFERDAALAECMNDAWHGPNRYFW